jgi:hypothetical protein
MIGNKIKLEFGHLSMPLIGALGRSPTRNSPVPIRNVMNGMVQIFLILWCLVLSVTASAEHQTYLRGIVNVPGLRAALLEIQHTLAHPTNAPPTIIPTSRLVRGPEQFEDQTVKAGHFQFEVLECNFVTRTVRTREDGEEHTYSFKGTGVPSGAKDWLCLQKAAFNDVVDIYSEVTGRTILLHPAVDRALVSLEAFWTNQVPEREEVTSVFEKYLGERGASLAVDGTRFLQIVPRTMSQTILVTSKDLPAGPPKTGGMLLSGQQNLVDMYAAFSGRRRKETNPVTSSVPYLRVGSLSQPELLYVLETFLRWNGNRIVLGDDSTFSIVPAQR